MHVKFLPPGSFLLACAVLLLNFHPHDHGLGQRLHAPRRRKINFVAKRFSNSHSQNPSRIRARVFKRGCGVRANPISGKGGTIEHVDPGSPDWNKTELFGDSLRSLLEPIAPLDDVPSAKLGTISLVGAGPGDPELLTVAAFRMLQEADIVICDRLVSQEIRELCKGEILVAKKYPGCADYAQMEIYRWIADGLRLGKRIVRLKIGDPFIFGRGAEEVIEIERLTRGRITPAVIPGVSSVFAAPLLGGATMTHRGAANSVILGTGYGRNKSEPAIVPYQPQTTAVFLMAIGRIGPLSQGLKDNGYPADTPVVVIEKASCSDQRVLLADLDTAPSLVSEHAIKPPATIVVGEAARVLYPVERYPQGLVDIDAMPIAQHFSAADEWDRVLDPIVEHPK